MSLICFILFWFFLYFINYQFCWILIIWVQAIQKTWLVLAMKSLTGSPKSFWNVTSLLKLCGCITMRTVLIYVCGQRFLKEFKSPFSTSCKLKPVDVDLLFLWVWDVSFWVIVLFAAFHLLPGTHSSLLIDILSLGKFWT